METTLRWLGRLLILISLSISAGIILLRQQTPDHVWGNTCYFYVYGFRHDSKNDYYFLLRSDRQRLALEFTPIKPGYYDGPEIHRTRYMGKGPQLYGWDGKEPAALDPFFLDLFLLKEPLLYKFRWHEDQHIVSPLVVAPHWCWSALFAVPAVLYFLKVQSGYWRARRRRLKNKCVKCGYDLRATPVRCPECNTPVNVSSNLFRKLRFTAGPLGMAGAVIVLVCLANYGSTFIWRKMNFYRWTLPTAQEYADIARPYQAVVEAIYDYRAEHGIPPRSTYSLVPRYLPVRPEYAWFDENELHVSSGYEYFHGLRWDTIEAETLIYFFDPDHEGWTCKGDLANEPLPLPRLSATRPTKSAADAIEMRLADFDRSIAEGYGPYNIRTDDYCGKISLLINQNRIPEALQSSAQAATAAPDWWFPEMILARYAPPENADAAMQRFSKWVDQNRTFYTCWCLAKVYRDRGRDEDAYEALRRGIGAPDSQGLSDVDGRENSFYCEAVNYAYRNRQHKLALDLCAFWSNTFYKDNVTLIAFQSAVELSQGQFEAAKADAEKAVRQGQIDDVPNLDKLQAAIIANDSSFVFDSPGIEFKWKLIRDPGREEIDDRH